MGKGRNGKLMRMPKHKKFVEYNTFAKGINSLIAEIVRLRSDHLALNFEVSALRLALDESHVLSLPQSATYVERMKGYMTTLQEETALLHKERKPEDPFPIDNLIANCGEKGVRKEILKYLFALEKLETPSTDPVLEELKEEETPKEPDTTEKGA